MPDGDEEAALDALLAERAVEPVYQPIVDLASGDVVGVEALARGPAGGPLERPDALFAAARRFGRLAELDSLCRGRAVQEAYAAVCPGPSPCSSTSSRSPSRPGSPRRRVLGPRGARRARGRRVHRARPHRGPGPALRLRRPGAGPRLPHRPRRRRGPASARRWGQGWWFGPGEWATTILPGLRPPRLVPDWRPPAAPVARASPYAVVARARTPRRAAAPLLLEVSHFLERQAAEMGELAVVVAAFERAAHFTRATRRRYRELARTAAFVGVLGSGMPAEPEPGVRAATRRPTTRWVARGASPSFGPHVAAALVARDLDGAPGPAGADPDRTFDYVLTHDRGLVLEVARSLLARTLPSPADVTEADLVSSVGVVSAPDR